MARNYGIISDLHHNPQVAQQAPSALEKEVDELDGFILNGDIGQPQQNLRHSQGLVAGIIEEFAKTGKETYVQPGSHETVGMFAPAVEHMQEKYSNVIDTTERRKVENDDHDIVFLPGSDFLASGEYKLGKSDSVDTDLYFKLGAGLMPFNEQNKAKARSRTDFQGLQFYSNMNDLEDLVDQGDKTVVVSHIPRKFDKLEGAVDRAYFAEKENGTVYPANIAIQRGLEPEWANRGNEDLRDLFETLGITKAVSAHFHESSQDAHDTDVEPVPEGEYERELFWNNGHGDEGEMGILSVEDGTAAYHNITL